MIRKLGYETEIIDKLFLELSQFTTAQTKKEIELQEKYSELIMGVQKKFPSETRHETALRYIRMAETPTNQSQCGKTNDR